MIFRLLSSIQSDRSEPAFSVFLQTQRAAGAPSAILFQSEHSRLAGDLARALRSDIFGELNEDVITAIAEHDYGWDVSDNQQVEAMERTKPRPFTQMSPEETLPCWLRSIEHGCELSPLAEVLISRHCCLLGTGSGKHARFVAKENERRAKLERNLLYSAKELHDWTAALGFCDLLSLYLCCGSRAAVTLPLAHPENRANERSVTLSWKEECTALPEPVFGMETRLQCRGIAYPVSEGQSSEWVCEWVLRTSAREPEVAAN